MSECVIWATRGRSWGFRFLLGGGFDDPLQAYERAFAGTDGERTVWRRDDTRVALRFPDPDGRCDASGRVIPHDIVVLPPLADDVRSVDDGRRLIWRPRLAAAFTRLWDQPAPPSATEIHQALNDDPGTLGSSAADDERQRSQG